MILLINYSKFFQNTLCLLIKCIRHRLYYLKNQLNPYLNKIARDNYKNRTQKFLYCHAKKKTYLMKLSIRYLKWNFKVINNKSKKSRLAKPQEKLFNC